ncbi:MAG: metal-dependent transcriptional regulator [Acutalibacter sp.]|nr:metal-dependent transcriptional regulator [Acutalibacter sp.]
MKKIQESAENYLETILILQQRNGAVRSIDIAAELEFSKPSVSVAMKNLREKGCVIVDGDGFITLTGEGRRIAEGVYERHLLFTRWLTSLGVPPELAAEDACRMEHVVSEETFRAIQRHVDNTQDAAAAQALHR